MLPLSVRYERKFEFQSAARKRAVGDQLGLACALAAKHPPKGSTFSVSCTGPTPSDHRDVSPFMLHTPGAESHGFLIVTPRLEFRATARKQSPGRFSNRYKTRFLCPPCRIDVFVSRVPTLVRNQRRPASSKFLIANLELEFFLSIAKSMKYKFLIANKCGF
jgi:hypothetical protein